MTTPMLQCSDDRRRLRMQGQECLFNGIEYVEAAPIVAGIYQLKVHFQERICAPRKEDWRIVGDRRADTLTIGDTSNEAGDTVTLTLCPTSIPDNAPYRLVLDHPEQHGVDPHFSSYEFRFPTPGSDLDDLDESTCAPRQFPIPQIDYLARDYGRLRRLLLDRLSVTLPQWRERHVPDIGVMLVELFAYIGDHLSYQQDAIATEAYLGTARQRISVRRHAKLVDYRLHEGCNARAFLHIEAPGGDELDPDDVIFIAGLPPGDTDPPEPVSLKKLDDEETLPLVIFEPFPLPRETPALSPHDIKDGLQFLSAIANSTRGSLAALGAALPLPLSIAIRAAVYCPPDSVVQLTFDVVRQINISLRELCLADLLDAGEVGNCSSATRRRMATCSRHQCPATTNRAILEDLFPELIARRVTKGERIRLYSGHNEIRFYTWDGSRCWLPRGTTSATLRDRYLPTIRADGCRPRALQNLAVGDLLLLEEVRGSRTGDPADADPLHRQVVSLTKVTVTCDSLVTVTLEDGSAAQLPIVEIEWHPDDALTFPLCLSARGRGTTDCHLVQDVSVARGNMILVDHGRTEPGEALPEMYRSPHHDPCADPNCCGSCSSESPPQLAARHYRPELKKSDLTFSQPLTRPARDDAEKRPMAASAMLTQQEHKAEPQLSLRGITPSPDVPETELPDSEFSRERLLQQLRVAPLNLCRKVAHLLPGKRCQEVASLPAWTPQNELEHDLLLRLRRDLEEAITWTARNDLIATEPHAREFTIEIDDERRTHLRFPEGAPNTPLAGSKFWATYRIGNGSNGNVGAGGITHIGFRDQSLAGRGLRVRNPLPATGGKDPEPVASARMLAPSVTRKLKRAVTAKDYEAVVLQEFPNEVQGARAQLIPGPLGQLIRLAIDSLDRVESFEELRREIERVLKSFKRIGHDLQVVPATEVPIHIEMSVRVEPGYHFEHLRAELLRTFSSGVHPDGTLGFFHPDLRSFGDGIFLSEIIAAARRVRGVRGVEVTKLCRLNQSDDSALQSGVLSLGPLEVAVMQRSSRRQSGILTITQYKEPGAS